MNVEAGREYINKATGDKVVVVSVQDDSVRFHDVGDDYVFVESLFYFQNDHDAA